MIFGYNNSKWPLVILTAEGSPRSEDEMNNMLEGWSNLYIKSMETNEKFRFIIDVRDIYSIDIKYLMIIAKYLVKVKNLTEKWMEKTGIIVSSNSIKLLIKFVFTIYKPVRPFKVFSEGEIEKSLNWVLGENAGDLEDEINSLKDKKLSKKLSKKSNIDFN
jgi:hypothetical protein